MVEINKILKITAGKFHCFCESNVGIIRKPNNVISDSLWNVFNGVESKQIVRVDAPTIETLKVLESKWYQKFCQFVRKIYSKVAETIKKITL